MKRTTVTMLAVACTFGFLACERDEPGNNAPVPPGPDAPPLTVLQKGDDKADLVLWFDSSASTMHIFQPDRLQELIADGTVRNLHWERGATTALLILAMPDGQMEFEAQARLNPPGDTLDWQVVSANVGDVRLLTRRRELQPSSEYLTPGCVTGADYIWQTAPAGTVGVKYANPFYDFLQGPGEVIAAEFVANTWRNRWYSDTNCQNFISHTDHGLHWVVSIRDFPGAP